MTEKFTEISNKQPYKKRERRKPRKISARYLENAGLYYLERYSSSSANFRRVMRRKIQRSCTFHETNPEDFYPLLEDLITRYISSKLLDDAQYCYAKTMRMRRQGQSARMIHAKLSQKGLSTDQINTALTKYAEEHDFEIAETERNAALKYARKRRLGPYRIPPDAERYQKDIAAMARAGFQYAVIKSVLGDIDALHDEDHAYDAPMFD